jgi:hypothetical protein
MKKFLTLGPAGVLVLLLWSTPAVSQTFTAQIQNFWNQLRTGILTFSTLRATTAVIGSQTIRAGSTTTAFRPSGLLFTPITADQSNAADTNFKCVTLGSLLANTVTKVGDTLRVDVDFLMAAGGSTRTVTLAVGGICTNDANGPTGGVTLWTFTHASAGSIFIASRIVCAAACTGASTLKVDAGYVGTTSSVTNGSGNTTAAVTVSIDQAIFLAFKDGASTNILLKNASVYWDPTP